MAKRTKIILGVGLVLVAAVGFGAFWLLKDDAAPRANLDDAAARAADETAEPTDTADTADTADSADVSGDWLIGSGSFAGYRIDEVLTIGNNTATARTDQVTGTLTIDNSTITDVSVSVDMGSLSSTDGNGIRDGRVSDALDTTNNPDATFELTEPIELGSVPPAGEPVEATASGELTLKGVTLPVDVAIDAQIEGSNLLVVGFAPVVLSDHGITAPSAGRVLSVEDAGELEFELIFERV